MPPPERVAPAAAGKPTMSNHVVVRCPTCAQKYRILPTTVGQRARCKKCGAIFRIATEQPIDDDTIVGWIINDDPSSESVTGSTGMFDDVDAGTRAGSAPGVAGPCVALRKIDEDGAHFEFPATSLPDETLRNGFSRKCVGCGARTGLSVHLIHWPEKMLTRDPLRWADYVDASVGRLETFADYSDRTLLLQLPPARHAVDPFTLPFPVFACSWCTVSQEIETHVVPVGGVEICRLRVAFLPAAVSFLRNTGGRETPDYYRLVEERDRRKEPWRELDAPVRSRVAKWFSARPGERFVRFITDTEMTAAEPGTNGIIVTSDRLILRKYGRTRDYPLDCAGRLEIIRKGDHAVVHIYESEHRPAAAHIDLVDADRLIADLQTVHCRWTITR